MNKLPIVTIQGGLGNQLFQWFFAHEIRESSEFRLYRNIPVGPAAQIVYEFGLTPIFPSCAHYKAIETDNRNLLPRIFDRLWTITILRPALSFLGYNREDPRSGIKAHKAGSRKIIYANGYFQNWQYAENQRETIQRELVPILEEKYTDLCRRFDLLEPYTAIHVRRGDYRADQNPQTRIGSLADKYFIDWALENSSKRLILLAEHKSDVKELISILKPFLVLDNQSTTAWEALAILSHASSLLGSNSTLSWWGAWVANARGGNVFLPAEWDVMGRFNPKDFHFPTCRFVSSQWENYNGSEYI